MRILRQLLMGWLWHALTIAGSMTWEILWALILGFALSAVVRRETVVRALGSDSPGPWWPPPGSGYRHRVVLIRASRARQPNRRPG